MSGLISYLVGIQSGILLHQAQIAGKYGIDISYNTALINLLIIQAVRNNNVSGYTPPFKYKTNEEN